MPRNFVVLRQLDEQGATEPAVRTGPTLRGRTPAPAAPRAAGRATPSVEIGTLPAREAREAVRRGGATVAAPVMPMRLVEPVAKKKVGRTAAEPPWGLGAVGALESPFSGKGIVVAVLDTGIDPDHPAFAGVALERRNFTSEGADDTHGHGTHCAGTIFGRAVNGRRIGVAPGVTRALIGKVLGDGGGGSDKVAEAIQWAVNGGAHVVSMSLGIDFPGYVEELVGDGVPAALATSMALEAYRSNIELFGRLAGFLDARSALGQPVLLVAAAGNESRRAESAEFEIAVSPPAVAEGVISVAALGKVSGRLKIADFSNTGARISGPGVDIVSAAPGGGLQSMSGTSMATPHVAGVVALWAEKLVADRDFRVTRMRDRLFGSASLTGLVDGFDTQDVGAGMARAPGP